MQKKQERRLGKSIAISNCESSFLELSQTRDVVRSRLAGASWLRLSGEDGYRLANTRRQIAASGHGEEKRAGRL